MKSFKRTVILIMALSLAAYGGVGLYYSFYSPETSGNYLWCAYHVHSTLSDGFLTPRQIAAEARKSRVDLVILTDHGLPHPETSTMDETIDSVRFIGGSEAGIPEGHINFFGAKTIPLFKLPPYPPDAFDDIREWGGFGVLTYPEDPRDQWQYWESDLLPDGIEIINITSCFRSTSVWGKLKTALFVPFSRFHFLKDITAPQSALERWDALLKKGKVLAFYAANAHGGFPITRQSKTAVPIPSYSSAFSLVGLGVDKEHQGSLEEAIRKGDFFSVIRGAGEPARFAFFGRLEGRIYPSGSSISGVPDLVLRVETERLAPRLVLKRNGEVVDTSKTGELRMTADSPGVYRAEAYLDDHPFLDKNVPWILSNPIFVDAPFESTAEDDPRCIEKGSLPLNELVVEKDEDSTGNYRSTEGGATFEYDLALATPQQINRWVALALRKKMDLSRFDGFYIEASTGDYMRYQVEIRSEDKSFYASFKLYPDRDNSIVVPLEKFYATFGGREPIPLAAIESFFITVNTSNSRTGFPSRLSIKEAGFCIFER